MKTIYSLLLLALFAGCSRTNDPDITDPFLGHWKAESIRSINYDATGKVTSDQTTVTNSQLDVSATTITFTSVANGTSSTEVDPYTRNGEALTITVKNGTAGETYFARNLTSTAFTFEFNGPRATGKGYYVQTIPYHR